MNGQRNVGSLHNGLLFHHKMKEIIDLKYDFVELSKYANERSQTQKATYYMIHFM